MKKKFFLCCLGLIAGYTVLTADVNAQTVVKPQKSEQLDLTQQYSDLLQATAKIQTNTKTMSDHALLLGSEKTELENFNRAMESVKASISALSNYQQVRKSQQIDLEWQPQAGPVNLNSPEASHWYNANSETPASPVYICRADFLGANVNSKGTYPGVLTASGCHISYGGFAFVSPNYQILIDNHQHANQLSWVSIKKINDYFQLPDAEHRIARPPVSVNNPVYRAEGYVVLSDFNAFESVFNIDPLKQPVLVSGGYEGRKPVYICRANYNNHVTVGKWVVYQAEHFKLKSACDIPSDDKEIVIKDNYDMLMVKNNH